MYIPKIGIKLEEPTKQKFTKVIQEFVSLFAFSKFEFGLTDEL